MLQMIHDKKDKKKQIIHHDKPWYTTGYTTNYHDIPYGILAKQFEQFSPFFFAIHGGSEASLGAHEKDLDRSVNYGTCLVISQRLKGTCTREQTWATLSPIFCCVTPGLTKVLAVWVRGRWQVKRLQGLATRNARMKEFTPELSVKLY